MDLYQTKYATVTFAYSSIVFHYIHTHTHTPVACRVNLFVNIYTQQIQPLSMKRVESSQETVITLYINLIVNFN